MKTTPRVILIVALLALSIIVAVVPVSAGHLTSSAAWQSPIDTPTPLPPATDTPIPPATNTPVPAATNTPIPAATNTPGPAATSTPFPTYAPPTYPPPPVYQIIGYWTVQPGQTLYCIGRYYKVSPWAIASVNYIPWPYYIYPGQVLGIPNAPWYNIPPGPVCYPGVPNVTPPPPTGITPTPPAGTPPAITPTPPAPPTCRYYHYVQWGQTLSGIAWYYGTTIQAIMYANPSITNPNLIYAGSTLCIP
jgi:LysM repeat protein